MNNQETLYPVKFFIETTDDGQEYYHRIMGNDMYFTATDLCECPEDATLYRDLFNGYDYIKAIELGIELARQGYTGLDIKYTKNEFN